MNVTMEKFGYPGTVVREYDRWAVLLRPQQATLGALVLCCKDAAERFSDISPAAFAELGTVVADAENTLGDCFGYQKINYLMLMMVDPDVHFHVLPRYAQPQTFGGVEFADAGWPGPPRLDAFTEIEPAAREALLSALRNRWPS